jgi:hypothetical protein
MPKVLWISTAISTLGILFCVLKIESNSYGQMLMIGAATLFVSLLVLGFLSLAGVKDLRPLVPVLLRAFPVLILNIYILSK